MGRKNKKALILLKTKAFGRINIFIRRIDNLFESDFSE